jgi:DNA mismatch repair ATPase MutS
MHFREHVEEGLLAFDYRLREGPCPTTNALRIMRLSGLPIPENPEIEEDVGGDSNPP